MKTVCRGALAPREGEDFRYAETGEFGGEAALLLEALGISSAGKRADLVPAEFQRAGFFLTHVLECPLESDGSARVNAKTALKERLAAVAIRIRRSLKPKRVMAVTEDLTPIVEDILALDLGCPVMLDHGKPFRLESGAGENRALWRLRESLAIPTTNG